MVLRSTDGADSTRDRFGNNASHRRVTGGYPFSTMVLAALLMTGLALACGHALGATITTHLLVFALGALYGGVMRKREARTKAPQPAGQKRNCYRPSAPRGAAAKRRFVKCVPRSDS